jgi:rifampicin phosphotransferase
VRWPSSPSVSSAADHDGLLALGSGAVAAAGIGPKAALLDRARRAGLPVPEGTVVPDGVDPPADPSVWGLTPLAVRSAFSAEDTDTSSLAGWFQTVLRVAPDGVPAAVEGVRASASAHQGPIRRDVLVMAMVEARTAGVAFSEPGFYDDLVNLTDGTAERLVAGAEPGRRVLLPRLEPAPRGWERRLQQVLRRVRRHFGDRPWDVEWADDGRRCWLVQLRPVTAPTRRDEALTIANHAEILPALPSALMTSVIAAAGPDLFAWYRRFDPSLPANRPFLEEVAGRPFINLSLLEDLLRHLGLPTRLVADSIGGPPERDLPARPARILRKSPVLMRMGAAQVGAIARAGAREERLAAIGRRPAGSFAEALEQLRAAHVGLVTGMFPLSSAIGPPLAVLRRLGVLVEHAARHRTVTTELAEAVDGLRGPDRSVGDLDAFLHRFGHRGIYESDVARPRYRDDPSPLLGTAAGPTPAGRAAPPPLTVRGRLTRPIWWIARPPLAARERLRHEAMRAFADVRDSLVTLAARAVAEGRLPDVDHLWLLTLDEARRLDAGWSPDDGFWASRRAGREAQAALSPPPVVHRHDDPAEWGDERPATGRLRGLSLTAGDVDGRAWVLQEPATDLPEGFDPATTVLVARSVDAGWIPTVALVAAVVVETGGDLSHGSILLRERGVPAVTNVRGATRAFVTGDPVSVRAGAGIVEPR